jgi:hypothetical protein
LARSTAGHTPNGEPHGQFRPQRQKSRFLKEQPDTGRWSALGKVADMADHHLTATRTER